MKYYSDRKKKRNSFNVWNNIYNQRVDNNVTKKFRELHNSVNNTEYSTDEITDAQGLERAYKHGDYYIHGGTMYRVGSHNLPDWYGNFIKTQVWGDLRSSARYKAAHDALMENPQVLTVLGHSLGSSVALELQEL